MDTIARFCWTELGTTDRDKAEKFYARLLGWESGPPPLRTASGQVIEYVLLSKGGQYVGGLFPMFRAQRRQGSRPQWVPYVQVEDADATAAAAQRLGARVLAGPIDVFDLGRLTLLSDPLGALFGTWQSRRLGGGFQTRDQPGFARWFEHASDDVEAAARFYSALFGWSRRGPGPAERVLLEHGGTPVASLAPRPPSKPAPQWLTYFEVSDCEAASQKAALLQGSVLVPPTPIPGAGTAAIVSDPQGAAFGLLTPPAG